MSEMERECGILSFNSSLLTEYEIRDSVDIVFLKKPPESLQSGFSALGKKRSPVMIDRSLIDLKRSCVT